METYESPIQKLSCSQTAAYEKLSDLTNLEAVKDRIPQDKLKDMTCDVDSCSFTIDMLGNVTLRIVERQPDHSIKFGADNSQIPFSLWIDLDATDETTADLKLKFEADIPFMIKAMVGGKIDGFLKQFAEMIALVLNTSSEA